MNNGEKIIGTYLLWKPTGGGKTRFLTSFYLKVVYGEKLLAPIDSFSHSFAFYQKNFLKNNSIRSYGQKYEFLRKKVHPLLDRKMKLRPIFV